MAAFRARMQAIDVEVCKQKVAEGAKDDTRQEGQQSMTGEEVDIAGKEGVAADVHGKTDQTAGHESAPLAHPGLRRALAEGQAAVEAPVPGNRRPEGKETR